MGKVVISYMRADLTNGEDKLIALSGIAKQMQGMLKDEYLAGLWRHNLALQLLWEVEDCSQANGLPSVRPLPYRAPSWSWASVDGQVDPWDSSTGDVLITILEACTFPVIDDVTGQIKDGYLRISANLFEAELYRSRIITIVLNVNNKRMGINSSVSPDVGDYDLGGKFYCMPIHSYSHDGKPWISGLVIQPVGRTRGTYTRFGYFYVCESENCQLFEASEKESQRKAELYEDADQLIFTII
jgi:hypothetical protein